MLRLTRWILAAGAILLAGASAHALSITTASLGGDKVCKTLACAVQTHSFGGSSAAGSGGSIALSGSTLTFSIDAGSATFSTLGTDASISLTDLSFDGSASVLSVAGSYVITGGSATVSGVANGSSFTASASSVGGTCVATSGGLACGITFSYLSSTPIGYSRAFFETVNLQAPEPSLGLLLGAGLLATTGWIARRRS